MKYNYFEAVKISKEKQKTYEEFFEQAGKPELTKEWFDSLPDGVHNVNTVRRQPMCAVGQKGNRYFEYPTFILAWGYEIPESAFLTDEQLNDEIWEVHSYNDDYDW